MIKFLAHLLLKFKSGKQLTQRKLIINLITRKESKMESSMNTRSQSVPSSSSSSSQIKKSVNQASSEVSDQVSQWTSQLKDISSEYIEEGTKFVKENPVQGAGIAAAVGVVIGCLATLALRRN